MHGKKASCPKIGNNEVLTNESLPLGYAQQSQMQSRTIISLNIHC